MLYVDINYLACRGRNMTLDIVVYIETIRSPAMVAYFYTSYA